MEPNQPNFTEFDTTTPIPPRSKWKELAERMPIGAHKLIDDNELSALQSALNKADKGIITRKSATVGKTDIWVTEKKKAKVPRKPRAKKEPATTVA